MLKLSGAAGSKSYQIVGDIMIVKLEKAGNIVELIRRTFPHIRTIVNMRKIEGELRKPDVEILWTSDPENPTETIHTEWGIKYMLDVAKTMFSKGNLLERRRIASLVRQGERVLDMFAGIGYFSIPVAKFSEPSEVVAIEKNPEAFHYLLKNIELNKVEIEAYNIDNREARLGEFDRVLMGYFPGTEKFLAVAKAHSHPETAIHYHNTYALHEMPWKLEEEIRNVFPKAEIIGVRKVKKFGPYRIHVVTDFIAGEI